MPVNLEWLRRAAPEADRGGFEIAHRRIKIDGVHVGEVGRRCDRQHVAALMGVALALYHGQRHFLAALEPAFAVCHCGNLAHCEAVHDGYRKASYA